MCELCDWKRFVRETRDLAEEPAFRKSADFLKSVAQTAERIKHATEAMASTVQKIEERGW